jgi:hypothetical protein
MRSGLTRGRNYCRTKGRGVDRAHDARSSKHSRVELGRFANECNERGLAIVGINLIEGQAYPDDAGCHGSGNMGRWLRARFLVALAAAIGLRGQDFQVGRACLQGADYEASGLGQQAEIINSSVDGASNDVAR